MKKQHKAPKTRTKKPLKTAPKTRTKHLCRCVNRSQQHRPT